MIASTVTTNKVNTNRGKILLVDDEPLVLEIIESALLKEGYDITCASDSQIALNYLEKSFFDALVCDLRLHDLDGFDVISAARRKSPSIGAILMTGAPRPEDETRAKVEQIFYLSKPIAVNTLLSKIEAAVNFTASFTASNTPLENRA